MDSLEFWGILLGRSIRLIADAIYLFMQIPVIAVYCLYLKNQLPVTAN